MKVELNKDKDIVIEVQNALRKNDYYCPCKIEHLPQNLCLCEDFRLRTAVGEYCGCGLYKKIEN